jgi:hypothetical protein
VPAELVEFDPADWPVEPEDPDDDDAATPSQQHAWRLRYARRRWRSARVDWLAERGQPTLPEFMGRQSTEAAEFARDIATFEREHPEDADQ